MAPAAPTGPAYIQLPWTGSPGVAHHWFRNPDRGFCQGSPADGWVVQQLDPWSRSWESVLAHALCRVFVPILSWLAAPSLPTPSAALKTTSAVKPLRSVIEHHTGRPDTIGHHHLLETDTRTAEKHTRHTKHTTLSPPCTRRSVSSSPLAQLGGGITTEIRLPAPLVSPTSHPALRIFTRIAHIGQTHYHSPSPSCFFRVPSFLLLETCWSGRPPALRTAESLDRPI